MRTGKPLTVYLPENLRERLQESAARNYRTKTAQVILALQEFLATDERTTGKALARPRKGK